MISLLGTLPRRSSIALETFLLELLRRALRGVNLKHPVHFRFRLGQVAHPARLLRQLKPNRGQASDGILAFALDADADIADEVQSALVKAGGRRQISLFLNSRGVVESAAEFDHVGLATNGLGAGNILGRRLGQEGRSCREQ